MAQPVTVTGSTSAVLIDSSLFTPTNSTAIVYLAGLDMPGHTVTIRDSAGYLSTPNKIVVSTAANVFFADGSKSITITQPYGYLTVTSRDVTSWILANSFGFPQNQVVASVSSLTAGSISTESMITNTLLSASLDTTNVFVKDNLISHGPAQYDTLVVGPPYDLVDGTNVSIYGNLRAGPATFGGNVNITGNLAAVNLSGRTINAQSLSLSTSMIVGGNIAAPSAYISALSVLSIDATIDKLIVSSSLVVGSSIAVAKTISSLSISTGSLYVSSQLNIGSFTVRPTNSSLVFSGGLTTPFLSTTYVTATSSLRTSVLNVTRSIVAPTLSTMQLSSTQIINPHGFLSISSINASGISTSGLVASSINTQQLQASSLLISGNIDLISPGYMTINTANLGAFSTLSLYASTLTADTYKIDSINVTSLNVIGSFTGPSLTDLFIPYASLTANSLLTSSITTSEMTTTSIYISSGIISSMGSVTINASNLTSPAISTTSVLTSSIYTSSLTANKLIIGSPIDPTNRGPYLVCTSSTNCIITGGPGDYVSPLYIESIKPPNYVAGTPYISYATFSYIIPNTTGTLPGNLIDIQQSLFWAGELNTHNHMYGPPGSGDFSLYGYFADDQTSRNQFIQGQTNTQSNAYVWQADLINNARATVILQSRSNANYNLGDYNNYINMQNGVLKWNYALNDTTIQNSLNDISTRNLIYYGSLNFVSDPRLKQRIEAADLKRCHDTIRDIPLHRYAFKDAYVSTFGITDVHRIGIMADEYEQYFPKSVTKQVVAGFSTIKTVDTQQLDMAHLGATQYLLKEVAELRSTLATTVKCRD